MGVPVRPSKDADPQPRTCLATTCLAATLPLDLPEGPPMTLRVRRDTPGYAPPAPAYHPEPSYGHAKGRVGPVYTFVKTDPKANFKWGVRHRAGAQYGRR